MIKALIREFVMIEEGFRETQKRNVSRTGGYMNDHFLLWEQAKEILGWGDFREDAFPKKYNV